MKVIVISTNNRPLQNSAPGVNEWLDHERPTVATVTSLLEQRLAKGDFKVLVSNLSDEATDKELARFLKESGEDQQLALDSFESTFSAVAERRRVVETEKEKAEREKAEQDAKEKAEKAEADRKALEDQKKTQQKDVEKK